jgi:3'-phosphoadenosine 5'-phosphosulfate sulfotransferase
MNLKATINKIKALSQTHGSYENFLVWILKSMHFINNLDIDPTNAKYLSYDQFSKNLSKIIKLAPQEVYVVFKTSL